MIKVKNRRCLESLTYLPYRGGCCLSAIEGGCGRWHRKLLVKTEYSLVIDVKKPPRMQVGFMIDLPTASARARFSWTLIQFFLELTSLKRSNEQSVHAEYYWQSLGATGQQSTKRDAEGSMILMTSFVWKSKRHSSGIF
jgi:hypothetical protein